MGAVPLSIASALDSRYALEREIGRGAMATVFLAEDRKHRRHVAIKILHPELGSAVSAERFLHEIDIVSGLSHPHILPLFDSGEAERYLYYVMPFVEGGSLRGRLERDRHLPLEQAVRVAREVADALSYAHDKGVIHRDIKPENILLSSGHALLSDFGIARTLADASVRLTQTGFAIGTPLYMSFEQTFGDREIDVRSDIYSLGCVLFEMLTGEPPYAAASPQQVMARRLTEPVPSPRSVRPGTPTSVEVAVTRALAKTPEDRFVSATAFAAALAGHDAEPGAPMQAGSNRGSIVVLPFENLSPDPDNAFFADGLAAEIISDLSKLKGLRVISQTSSMLLRGARKDLRTIGRELGVSYVLEGSVRRAGNALRITTKLVDAATDTHLWGDKYTGTLDDVFELQERLSRAIVDSLRVALTPEEENDLAARPIPDVRAYECYLRARHEIMRQTEDSLDRALRLVEQALAIVGENELLQATRGYIYWSYENIGARRGADPLSQVDTCIEKVLAVNPASARGFFLKGLRACRAGDMAAAVRYLRRSADIEQSFDTLIWLSIMLADAGQIDEALRLGLLARELDPLTPSTTATLGLIHLLAGKVDAALTWGRKAIDLDPTDVIAVLLYGSILAHSGRREQALVLFDELATLNGGVWTSLGVVLAHALRHDRQRTCEAALDVTAATTDEYYSLVLAEAHALVGALDEALAWLEIAVQRGFINYPFLSKWNTLLDNVRGDDRFAALMVRVERKWSSFEASAR